MKNRLFIVAVILTASILILGCTLSRGPSARVTATPTKTARPMFTATLTPEPTATATSTLVPTYTPVPPTDTSMPTEPPAATDTPLPTETPASSPTPIEPTVAPPPTNTSAPAAPTDTPRPRATNTPALPTNTPKPKVDFQVVKQDIVPKSENTSGLYTIYIRVEDRSGNPLNGVVVWDPGQPGIQVVTGDKPGYYHAEYLMGGGDYYLEVKDANSEKTKRLTTVRGGITDDDLIRAGYCVDAADCAANVGPQHFSWRVVFRRTW